MMPSVTTCRHHWLIDSPAGPTSAGECKNCGERRTFKNSLEAQRYVRSPRAIEAVSIQAWPKSYRQEER